MPRRISVKPKPVTNEDLAEGISNLKAEVVPRLERIEELTRKAGLNGFSEDIHDFFEQRAESVAARQWLSRRLRPVARFRYLAAAVAFASTAAWATLGIRQIVVLLHH